MRHGVMTLRRPVAVFGLVYLFTMLAAARGPAWVAVPMAVLPAAALLVLKPLRRRFRLPVCTPVVLAAVLCAAVVFQLHSLIVVRPVQRLYNTAYTAEVRVTQAAPAYGGDAANVTLQVLELSGQPVPHFSVELRGFAEVDVGDVVQTDLSFFALSGQSAATARSRGVYIGARADGAEVTGQSLTPLLKLRRLQYAASDNIRSRLPLRLSSVAAAMSVGDKRFLSAETRTAYRAAGLSHTLVVSGLHLSILTGALYAVLRKVLRRRRAALVCLFFVALFMAFTGFTPSVVRSGVAYLLVFTGEALRRKADIYTSLGVAAVLLCTQNPYAACDVGLLLSFSATLGALAGGAAANETALRAEDARGRPKQLAWRAGGVLCVPVCVTLATLPVLVLFGLGISALTVPMNIVAVPLVTPVVLGGLLMALPQLPVFNLFAEAGALVAGTLLALLDRLVQFCAGLGGTFYLPALLAAAVLLLYPLGWLAFKSKRFTACVLAGTLLLFLAVQMHVLLDNGMVRITLVGNADNPSVVVTQNGKAAVLLRDRRATYDIETLLARENIRSCALLIDLRQNPQDTAYLPAFPPRQVVRTAHDVVSGQVYLPFGDVEISVQKQGEGTLACVDVARYKVALATGSFLLEGPAQPDVMVAGRGSVAGYTGTILSAGGAPGWAGAQNRLLVGGAQPQIQLRAGKSVVFREVYDGIDEG